MQYAIEFDHRSDAGPTLVGPFTSRDLAVQWASTYIVHRGVEASYVVAPLARPYDATGPQPVDPLRPEPAPPMTYYLHLMGPDPANPMTYGPYASEEAARADVPSSAPGYYINQVPA